ncbi:MAG TPA: hypothetical protein VGI81_11255 [Tepidisphaeraceae bacterium]|jgi:hypothetical protein
MTDAILNATIVLLIGTCVAYGLLLRVKELRAERRRGRGAFHGINRFRSALNAEDLSSLN